MTEAPQRPQLRERVDGVTGDSSRVSSAGLSGSEEPAG